MNLKISILVTSFLFFIFGLMACGEDIQLPNQIAQGQINGVDWNFEIGKSNTDQTSRVHLVELYNFVGFPENEGCLLFPGNSPYLSMSIPFGIQSGQQIDAIVSNLVFHQDAATALTADRGFIEISFVNNREIRGFISSGSSTDNSIEGFFSVLICN